MIETIYNFIKSAIVAELAAYSKTLDFAAGDYSDTIVLYISEGIAKIIDYAKAMMQNAFISTCSAEFLLRKCNDFGVSYSVGEYATGVIKFTRLTNATVDYVIPAGTIVSTSQNRYMGLEFFTTEEVILLTGTASVEADIQASLPGDLYNLTAGTIQYLSAVVEGVTGLVQEADITGGVNQDTIDEIRAKLLDYVRNIGRATIGALIYRAKSITGVKYVSIKENPDGWLTYEDDTPLATYTGSWSEETGDYRFGTAKFSDTATDEVSVQFEGTQIKPILSGGGIVDCYINDVFVESLDESSTLTCTFDLYNTLKMVVRSGDVYVDGFEVYSPYKRNSEILVYVDDGTGTASWALMNTVKDDLYPYWRACGIYLHLNRTEVELIDLEINVEWEQHAKTTEVKDYAETQIALWMSKQSPNTLIRMCNIIPIVLPITVAGRRQVKCCSVVTPNYQLDYQTSARLGEVTWNEYY
jgi:hypothetical protein